MTASTPSVNSPLRTSLRWFLVVLYLAAGILHLISPTPFLAITPDWVPYPAFVIEFTGIAEIIGAVCLAQSWSNRLRRMAGIGLALYALCVFPANINHLLIDMGSADPKLGWIYHGPRMVAQPILIWLALWVSNVTDWPFKKPLEKETEATI
jgi:uncharacterized membrane protein